MQYAFAVLSAAVVVFSVLPGTADAQQATPQQISTAKHHFHRAQQFKQLKEYASAAREFLLAYQVYKDAEFYFNAAQMYRLAGHNHKAVVYFLEYLKHHPNGRVATAAKTALDAARGALKREAARTPIAAPQRPPPSAAADPNVGNDDDDDDDDNDDDDDDDDDDSDDGSDDSDRGNVRAAPWRARARNLRFTSIGAAGVAAVALGVGVKFGLDARSAGRSLSTGPYSATLDAEGRAAQARMFVAYGIGTAALVGSATLYYFSVRAGRRAQRERSVSVTTQLSPSSMTVAVAGRF